MKKINNAHCFSDVLIIASSDIAIQRPVWNKPIRVAAFPYCPSCVSVSDGKAVSPSREAYFDLPGEITLTSIGFKPGGREAPRRVWVNITTLVQDRQKHAVPSRLFRRIYLRFTGAPSSTNYPHLSTRRASPQHLYR